MFWIKVGLKPTIPKLELSGHLAIKSHSNFQLKINLMALFKYLNSFFYEFKFFRWKDIWWVLRVGLEQETQWTFAQSSSRGTELEKGLWIQLGGGEGQGEGGRYRESNMETCITILKIDSQWELAIWLRKFKPGLGNNLEVWDGKRGGTDFQMGGDMGKPMADSCSCLVEANAIL